MTKIKKCYSIDEQNAGQIGRIASQKGVTESDVLNSCIEKSLVSEPELTSVERYHYQRVCIMKSLDSLLRLCGITQAEGGCRDKFKLALYACHGNSIHKNREFRNGTFEISLFEILNNIKDMDKDIYKQISTDMSYFGRIRERYFSLYPKNEKSCNTRRKKDRLYTNNNTTTNSVTDLKSPEDSNLSDEEYLKKKRSQEFDDAHPHRY